MIPNNEAIAIYAELALFKDSLTRMAACQAGMEAVEKELAARKAERTEAAYQKALTLENEGKYREAIEAYKTLNGYKDSADRIIACENAIKVACENAIKVACENAIKEEKYQVAFAFEESGDYASALKIYQELNDYKDCAQRLEVCKSSLKPA